MYAHTTSKPCLACRHLVKGNELEANGLLCSRCGHFHRSSVCPVILADQPPPCSSSADR